MKGLDKIPSEKDMLEAYHTLSKSSVKESSLVKFSQWARLDPRLAEILTHFLHQNWQQLSAPELNRELRGTVWPAAFGVLLAHIEDFHDPPSKTLFRNWANCVMTEVEPAPMQQFFIGTRRLAGKEMLKDATLALKAYRRWGFLGRDVLRNKWRWGKTKTAIPRKSRMATLRELLQKSARITTEDYVRALGGGVSRRQAQRDLQSVSLHRLGNTRGRWYRKRR